MHLTQKPLVPDLPPLQELRDGAPISSPADLESDTAHPSVPSHHLPSPSAIEVDTIETEYHPHTGKAPRRETLNDYRQRRYGEAMKSVPAVSRSTQHEPWHPFATHADFEFSELSLNASLSRKEIDNFFDIQSKLPPTGKPIGILLYSDKTELSTFGGQKGYPVYAQIANLPSEIRNGTGLGGGRVVGWLPVIKDTQEDAGKPAFVDFKRVVWHKSFEVFLATLKKHSKDGCWVKFCLVDGDDMAKFLEQYVMRTTEASKHALEIAQKHSSKEKQNEALNETGLRAITNAFWEIENSDPYQALSWDRLHSYPGGLGRHLIDELNVRFKEIEDRINHQLLHCLRSFLNLNAYSSFENFTGSILKDIDGELKVFAEEIKVNKNTKNWNFPKLHTHMHMVRDILGKGATKNFNTKPNEAMHKVLKMFYLFMTNFRDIDEQIVTFEHWCYIAIHIRDQIDTNNIRKSSLEDDEPAQTNTGRKYQWENVAFGSPQKTVLLSKFSTRTAIGEENYPPQLDNLDLISSMTTLLNANPAATDFKITSTTMRGNQPCKDFEEAIQAINLESSSDDDDFEHVLLPPAPSAQPQPRIQQAGSYASLQRTTPSQQPTCNSQTLASNPLGQAPIAGLPVHQVPDLGALTTQIQKNVEARYQQIVRDSQLEIGHLKEQLRELSLRNEQMENQMRQAGVRRKKKNTQDQEIGPVDPEKSSSDRPGDPSTGNAERDDTIRDTARKFTVMTNLFPVTEWFMAPLPANFIVDATRYDTDESKLNANIFELYEEVPQSLHDALLKTTSFRQVFIAARNAHVRTMTFSLRDGIGASAFDSEPPIPGISDEEMNYIFPVLFPGGVRNVTLMFRNVAIARMLRGFLFGAGTVKPETVHAKTWTIHGKCFAKVHGVKELTPAMIALASVLAVFWKSNDQKFAPVGEISKIEYQAAFEFYKEFIIRTYNSGDLAEWMDDLFEWYHNITFPSQTAAQTHRAKVSNEQARATQMSHLIAELQRELRAARQTSHPPAPNPNIPAPTFGQQATPNPPNNVPSSRDEPVVENALVLAAIPEEVEPEGVLHDGGLPAAAGPGQGDLPQVVHTGVPKKRGEKKGGAKKTPGATPTRQSSQRKT
ncbi:hypothetical protein MD484_g8754, partial [Candolleomyces efflorescens]